MDPGPIITTAPKYGGKINASVARLWDRYYPDRESRRFEKLIESTVRPDWHVLEIGAGSGVGNQRHCEIKGHVARYVGVDLDERVLKNPHLDAAEIADAAELPFGDATFHLVFHLMVAEHLRDPRAALQEWARVLKRGGWLMFATPSKWYYPMLIARVTPHWFHEFYVGRFGSGRGSKDVFPTFYRLNDRTVVNRMCDDLGLDASVEFVGQPPGYLRFHQLAFMAGVAYERLIERLWEPLAGQMIVRARKV